MTYVLNEKTRAFLWRIYEASGNDMNIVKQAFSETAGPNGDLIESKVLERINEIRKAPPHE